MRKHLVTQGQPKGRQITGYGWEGKREKQALSSSRDSPLSRSNGRGAADSEWVQGKRTGLLEGGQKASRTKRRRNEVLERYLSWRDVWKIRDTETGFVYDLSPAATCFQCEGYVGRARSIREGRESLSNSAFCCPSISLMRRTRAYVQNQSSV